MNTVSPEYPKAYKRWTQHEDDILRKSFEHGVDIQELSETLQRQQGAIKSRLYKLGVLTSGAIHLSTETAFEIKSLFRGTASLHWKTILCDEGLKYWFPHPITSMMMLRYNRPAIYRWTTSQDDYEQRKIIYIGQCRKLCPDRLVGYLDPQLSKTNVRLSLQFNQCIQQGYNVGLEILYAIGGVPADSFNLHLDSVRLFIERLLIIHYRQNGLKLLNY